MFSDKCKKCGEKVTKNSNFCSKCGFDLSRNYEPRDYGMLGKDDFGPLAEFPFGIPSLIGNLMNQVNKQMKEMVKETENGNNKPKPVKSMKQSGISISISSSSNGEPRIKIKRFGNGISDEQELEEVKEVIPENNMSEEKARQVSKLPKEEAKSSIRRLTNKIIYEIEIPGVKNLEDVIIHRLESGIEVKAFSDKKAYFKNLPVTYPISNYKLLKPGKLIIELEEY